MHLGGDDYDGMSHAFCLHSGCNCRRGSTIDDNVNMLGLCFVGSRVGFGRVTGKNAADRLEEMSNQTQQDYQLQTHCGEETQKRWGGHVGIFGGRKETGGVRRRCDQYSR